MGAHSKPPRVRLPQAASAAAAAPTLAGVAAAFCLAPTASAAAAVVPVASTAGPTAASTASNHVTIPAAYQKGGKPVKLLADNKSATSHKASARTYTVRPGDSLSAIAGHFYHNANAWPVLYYGNRSKIRWANDINVGQVLTIPAKPARIPSPPAQLSPQTYTPRHARTAPVTAEVQTTTTTTSTAGYYGGGPYPGGAFGACVVARESGGNPQIWNASGHYGLYQFSYSTWVAYGGSPAEFGHATVAEQNAVFATALAQGGQNNWAPYDGC